MEEFELEPGEIVITTVRTHVFVLFLHLFPFFILALAPWLLMIVIAFFTGAIPHAGGIYTMFHLPRHSGRFLIGLWLLFVWIGAFSTFTRYWLTIWVITNLRIVDIRQPRFFARRVSSFMLTHVQDITTDISGFLATMFSFGSLSVETAGNEEDFNMDGIADPAGVRDIIMTQVALLHKEGYHYSV